MMKHQPSRWRRFRLWLTASPWPLIILLTLAVHLSWILPWLRTPPDAVYTGYVGGGDDYWSYLAKMRQGWDGQWRWTNLYSPTGEASWFLYPFYLALGNVTRWVGADFTHLPVVFHLSALVLTPAVLWLIWRLTLRVVPESSGRLWSLILAFAASAGTILLLFVQQEVDRLHVLDMYPAPHPYVASMIYPHYLVNLLGMMGAILLLFRYLEAPRWQHLLSALLCIGAVTMVHPHVAAFTVVVMGVYSLTLPGAARWQGITFSVIAGVGALPYGLYLLSILHHPELQSWRSAAVQGPPEWYLQPFWLGLSVPLAVLAAPGAYREGRASRLMVIWLAAAYVLSNARLPLTAGGAELLMGLSVPAGLLVGRILGKWPGVWRESVGAVTLAGALYMVAALTMDGTASPDLGSTLSQVYITRSEIGRLAEFATPVSKGAILAPKGIMAKLPWLTGRRVVYGHTTETPGGTATRNQAEALCKNDISLPERDALLRRYRISAVLTAPGGTGENDGLACVDPTQ